MTRSASPLQVPDPVVGLGEIRDPVGLLMGARIPIIEAGAPAEWARLEWVVDRLLVRLCPEGVWLEKRSIPDWRAYSVDCAHPNVAAWADEKIDAATVTGLRVAHPRLVLYRGDSGDPWDGWVCSGRTGWATQNNLAAWPPGTWTGLRWDEAEKRYVRPPYDCPSLASVPWDEAHIPHARAAILRDLFGTKEGQ